jgi:hypothetical protein
MEDASTPHEPVTAYLPLSRSVARDHVGHYRQLTGRAAWLSHSDASAHRFLETSLAGAAQLSR